MEDPSKKNEAQREQADRFVASIDLNSLRSMVMGLLTELQKSQHFDSNTRFQIPKEDDSGVVSVPIEDLLNAIPPQQE